MFWTKLAKKGLKQKKWKYHQIYLILNSVGAKFQLKLTISNISEKKMKIAIEYCIFKIV